MSKTQTEEDKQDFADFTNFVSYAEKLTESALKIWRKDETPTLAEWDELKGIFDNIQVWFPIYVENAQDMTALAWQAQKRIPQNRPRLSRTPIYPRGVS